MNNALKADEVKRNALKEAQRFEKLAKEKAAQKLFAEAANYYRVAAKYYYTTGNHNFNANQCWDAEDACLEMAAQS